MVPVLLAPPPCANAGTLNDNAISRANSPVQRLMVSSLWGSTRKQSMPSDKSDQRWSRDQSRRDGFLGRVARWRDESGDERKRWDKNLGIRDQLFADPRSLIPDP